MAQGSRGRRGSPNLVNSKRLEGFRRWLKTVDKPTVVMSWARDIYGVSVEELGKQKKRQEKEYSPKYEGDASWILKSAQSSLETGTPLIDKWVKHKKFRVEFWEILYDFTKEKKLGGDVVINPDQLFNAMRVPDRLDDSPEQMVPLIDENVSNTDIFIELAKQKGSVFGKNKSIITNNLQCLSDASLADVRKLSDAMGSSMSFGDIVENISDTQGVNGWLEHLSLADKKAIKDTELKSLIQVAGDQKLKLLGHLENIYKSKGDQNPRATAFLKLAERKPKGLLERLKDLFGFGPGTYYDKNFIKENIIDVELLERLNYIQNKAGLSSDECSEIEQFKDAKAIILPDERQPSDALSQRNNPTKDQYKIFFSMARNKDLQTYIKGNPRFDDIAVSTNHIETIVRCMDYLSDASFTEMMLYTPRKPRRLFDPIGSFLDYFNTNISILKPELQIKLLSKINKIPDMVNAYNEGIINAIPSHSLSSDNISLECLKYLSHQEISNMNTKLLEILFDGTSADSLISFIAYGQRDHYNSLCDRIKSLEPSNEIRQKFELCACNTLNYRERELKDRFDTLHKGNVNLGYILMNPLKAVNIVDKEHSAKCYLTYNISAIEDRVIANGGEVGDGFPQVHNPDYRFARGYNNHFEDIAKSTSYKFLSGYLKRDTVIEDIILTMLKDDQRLKKDTEKISTQISGVHSPLIIELMERHTNIFFKALDALDPKRKNEVIKIARTCLDKKLSSQNYGEDVNKYREFVYDQEKYRREHHNMLDMLDKIEVINAVEIEVINAVENDFDGFKRQLEMIDPEQKEQQIQYAIRCLAAKYGENGGALSSKISQLKALSDSQGRSRSPTSVADTNSNNGRRLGQRHHFENKVQKRIEGVQSLDSSDAADEQQNESDRRGQDGFDR